MTMRSILSACTRVGGAAGALLTGVFAVSEYGGTAGLIEGNAGQVLNQAIGVGCVFVYDVVVTLIILKVVDLAIGLARQRGCRARRPRSRAARRDRAVAGAASDPRGSPYRHLLCGIAPISVKATERGAA